MSDFSTDNLTGTAETGLSLQGRQKVISMAIQPPPNVQAVAVDLADSFICQVQQAGTIRSAWVMSRVVCGAGESMVVDLKKNGVVIGTVTIGAASPIGTQLPIVLTVTAVARGDLLAVSRDYTVGATPTPMTITSVRVEYA